ncbi:hypothetical protein ACIQNG_35455 [Streptomyces sp. NPDC091377]|uniref:hypothetical protein n=1 Tax=Streptomyces sp. NPDC091377 TaxID=3365995 RepID=UPI0038301425
MPDNNPCDGIRGTAKEYCERGQGGPPADVEGGGGLTEGASEHVKGLAENLIDAIKGLLAPGELWAPEEASGMYEPFLWLGQHLAVAIFLCVVVVCALTAWQGTPRLKQMGASTGWTLAAVAGMASVPGAVMLLNKAVSNAFTAAFNSNESTLFGVISHDLEQGTDAGNPLATMLITAALVVALGFAVLVFMVRQLGILAFVWLAPLVLASLARGGDMSAVRAWASRLMGLMFAPFALLLISPFVPLTEGSLVMDAVLLVAADVLMLRMIFHGVPYIGPRVARAARVMVERNTTHPAALAVVRAGVPAFYEEESTPRGPRTVDTPGRSMSRDRGVLLAAYGVKQDKRPGRLTTESAVAKTRREETERAARNVQIVRARQQARTDAGVPPAGARPRATTPRAQGGAAPQGQGGQGGTQPPQPPQPRNP